jgi:hypothetical protein
MVHPDREFPSTHLKAVAEQKISRGWHWAVTKGSPYSTAKHMPVSQFLA